MSKFSVGATAFPEVLEITPRILEDSRGFFLETWEEEDFRAIGIADHFVQDYWTRSKQGVLRGLHFRAPGHGSSKLIRCVQGEIFDVVVDIRPSSPTFKTWQAFSLSATNRLMLYVPAGFAHGFYALSEFADVAYKTSAHFVKEYDLGIKWNDPEIGIAWPKGDPILSDKDTTLPLLRDILATLAW